MPSAWEEDSVTGTLKQVKSSVVRSGGIVLRWSSAGGQFLRTGFDRRPDTSFDVHGSSCLLSGPGLQLDSHYSLSVCLSVC